MSYQFPNFRADIDAPKILQDIRHGCRLRNA